MQSVHRYTQLLSRLDTFEAENKKMRERIHELEAIHENETNGIASAMENCHPKMLGSVHPSILFMWT